MRENVTVNTRHEMRGGVMGRKPIGAQPMTATERKQRERAKFKAQLPARGTVLEFRIALLNFVNQWRELHPTLTGDQLATSLESFAECVHMDTFCKSPKGKSRRKQYGEEDWLGLFVQHSAGMGFRYNDHDEKNWR
jgi:hypothetical protein